jgi:hypothetical protein
MLEQSPDVLQPSVQFSCHSNQECFFEDEGKLMGPVNDAGIVNALVATLQHDSPFCVAAAAGPLGWVAQARGGGKACIEASGAVPALVQVIARSLSPGNLEEETDLFRRYGLECRFRYVCARACLCVVGVGRVNVYVRLSVCSYLCVVSHVR